MKFDKWFNSQDTLVKAILMLIPVVGWIVEFLVRLSVALRTGEPIHWVVFLVFAFIGWTWVLVVADFIYLILKGNLFLAK